MKKLPYGISNYERLIEENYYYVDKTEYIEKLENLAETNIMFLRPRKFGKTLFTSTLENYYDIQKADKFEKLFGETYIGKNPTTNKNRYYVIRFNFSGINTETEESTMKGFREKTEVSIRDFVQRYKLDFYINPETTTEGILYNLFDAFKHQKPDEKMYVIIDEYDHFANELLGFNTKNFKALVSKNGKVRKWYEILKEGTEKIVDRIFITGVAPITLDSLTSGFNICSDKTQDRELHEMLGFTREDIEKMMEDQEINKEEQKQLLPIMKENYDGYKFSTEAKTKIYNSNMCLYFLNEYGRYKEIPKKLVDMNIASDYAKLGKMLDLCKEEKGKVIEQTVSGEGIITEITGKFNPELEFTEKDLASMLFYLGYLTIEQERFGLPKLNIPNRIMREIYSDYFLNKIKKSLNIEITNSEIEIAQEILEEGKIEKVINVLHIYLNNLSNRDYERFDEKYVKIIFYSIVMNLGLFRVKSEMEVNRKYPDLLLIPKPGMEQYYSVMIEFKYLKKQETSKLKGKQQEAKEQIEEYSKFEEIAAIEKLRKYAVVAVNDEIYVEEVK